MKVSSPTGTLWDSRATATVIQQLLNNKRDLHGQKKTRRYLSATSGVNQRAEDTRKDYLLMGGTLQTGTIARYP